jgi:hypothetical protein
MAISAADSARVNRVLTTTFDRYSPKISNEIVKQDGILRVFAAKKAIVVKGGQRPIHTLDMAQNPNVAFRDRNADIPTAKGDSRKQAMYNWATITGAVTLNNVERAMNQGEYAIYDLVEAEMENLKNTISNEIATALRAATPDAFSPESIRTMIPATASQTTTTGELSRATNSFWRSQYSSTAYTVNATAGLQGILGFMNDSCNRGFSDMDKPNFGLTTGLLYAALSAGHGDALRRYAVDSDALKLGFNTIQIENATIIQDSSVLTGSLYLINTNFLNLQILKENNQVEIGDRIASIPLTIGEFQKAINSLHTIALVNVSMALTCGSLQRQGLMTGLI